MVGAAREGGVGAFPQSRADQHTVEGRLAAVGAVGALLVGAEQVAQLSQFIAELDGPQAVRNDLPGNPSVPRRPGRRKTARAVGTVRELPDGEGAENCGAHAGIVAR